MVAIAICIDEVFISPLWVIVFLLRFALPPFLVPCRAGMHARSTREGDECVYGSVGMPARTVF